jgi:localization factor PodJL
MLQRDVPDVAMKSDTSTPAAAGEISGLKSGPRETGHQAGQHAGMSIGQWLDRVALSNQPDAQAPRESLEALPPGPDRPMEKRSNPEQGEPSSRAHPAQPELPNTELGQRLIQMIEKLGHRLDQLTAEDRSPNACPGEPEIGNAVLPKVSADRSPPVPAAATPLDQAVTEIAARQRALDGAGSGRTSTMPAHPASLPRARTQEMSALEQQLRQISAHVKGLKPCGVDRAIDTLRDDLAEIGLMLQEAMPRKTLEAIEHEVRKLADRIDRSGTSAGAEPAAALSSIERGLVEVRDTLRTLAPAVDLSQIDRELQQLSRKVDVLAQGDQDPSPLGELSAAIKSVVDRIERVRPTPGDLAGHIDERISKLLDKLDASDARLNHLEGIEHGLSQLMLDAEHARYSSGIRNQGELSRELSELTQSGKKTQEYLEAVHGTLGHVIDRLAMIETEMRSTSAQAESFWPRNKPAGTSLDRPVGLAAPASDDQGELRGKFTPAPDSSAWPPKPGSTSGPPAPEVFAPEPSRVELERDQHRPIDANLPPDHPLEPGHAGELRSYAGSAADRIAASERVLIGTNAAEPAVKTDFIAAARRAAQAGREAPVASASSASSEIVSRVGKLARRLSKLRALIAGTTAIIALLGALHLATTLLGSQQAVDADPEQQLSRVIAAPERPANIATATTPASPDVTPAVNEPTPAARDRQSESSPAGAKRTDAEATDIAHPAVAPVAETATETAPLSEPEVTGSFPAPSGSAESSPPAAHAAKTTGEPVSAATSPQPKPAGLRSDKLPASFSSSLRTAALTGDAGAQYEIGRRYAEGRDVAQDLTSAAEWFERAAKRGLAPAQFRLAGLYEKGLGVKKNLESARRLYILAGEAGNGKALHNVAVLYAEGIDGKADYQIAARWFSKAAKYGIADSQYNLGVLYARGIGVEQNPAEAYKWFALAAQQGDLEAAKKRDEIGNRLDRPSLEAATKAIEAWSPEEQPQSAVEIKAPPEGWDQAGTSRTTLTTRAKPPASERKHDLATPPVAQ